ncbi:MAG: hypothetical protein FWD25_10980 [Clostridia bacterium]|nr:hypothetical protein [Clostridia bacterium]
MHNNTNSPLRNHGNPAFWIIGLVFTLIGAPFLGVGLFIWQTQAGNMHRDDHLALSITFCVIGVIFLCVGLGFLLGHFAKRKHIRTLMREGACYDAEVVNAYFSNVRVNYQPGVILECKYVDTQGATRLVKSGSLWRVGLLRRPEDYRVRVWVDHYNPKKYFVEVLDDAITGSVDYDDR